MKIENNMDQISRKIATSSINEKLKKAKRLQAAKIYKQQRRNDPITGPLERAVSKYRKRIKRIRKGDPDFEKFKGKGLLAAEARRLAMEELGIKDNGFILYRIVVTSIKDMQPSMFAKSR